MNVIDYIFVSQIMSDPSIDVNSKDRTDIQAELAGFGLKTNQNTV